MTVFGSASRMRRSCDTPIGDSVLLLIALEFLEDARSFRHRDMGRFNRTMRAALLGVVHNSFGKLGSCKGPMPIARVHIFCGLFAVFFSIAVFPAFAQSPAPKHRSPGEIAAASRLLAEKYDGCRRQARERGLHLLKRRRFIRDCVKGDLTGRSSNLRQTGSASQMPDDGKDVAV